MKFWHLPLEMTINFLKSYYVFDKMQSNVTRPEVRPQNDHRVKLVDTRLPQEYLLRDCCWTELHHNKSGFHFSGH